MRDLVKWSEVVSRAHRWKSGSYRHEYAYGDVSFNRLVVTDLAESWDDFLEWSSRFHNWGFRGQQEASWTLQSSQERRIKVDRSYGNIRGHHQLNRKIVGEKLLSEFRQLAPLHLPDLPSNDDSASWLAAMQHYGGPTRLLDWTKCPFVGMYFALREAPTEGRSAVWAIDLDWLKRKEREILGTSPTAHDPEARLSYQNSLLGQSQILLVVPIDPQWKNERVAAQEGFFLWKLYEETLLFDDILMPMMLHPEIVQSPVIRKLEVSPELRSSFLERLFREKNTHEAALFPGRDFCEPLRLELRAMVERAEAEYEEGLRSVQMGEVVRG